MNTMEMLEQVLYPNIVAVILVVTVLEATRREGGRPARISRIVNFLSVVLVVMVALQIFCTMTDGTTNTWLYIPKFIATSVHNSFTVLYPGLCCIFVYEYTYVRGKSKWIWALLLSPYFVWVAILIINGWTGWVFTIDESMDYHRGFLVYATFILPMFSVVAATIISRVGFQGNKVFLRFPIWIFAVPAIAGVSVQALFEGVNTIHLGLALGLCGACVSLQKDKYYHDTLTGLYNRSYLFYIFSRIGKRKRQAGAGAIMLDINDFKYINDEFGHQEGDRALKEVAAILEKSLENGGTAIRFAGDEFVIFMLHKDIKKALAETVERIRFNTDIFNNMETGKYKIHFAIGSSVMEEGESPDELLSRTDEEMYRDKKNSKDTVIPVRRRA